MAQATGEGVLRAPNPCDRVRSGSGLLEKMAQNTGEMCITCTDFMSPNTFRLRASKKKGAGHLGKADCVHIFHVIDSVQADRILYCAATTEQRQSTFIYCPIPNLSSAALSIAQYRMTSLIQYPLDKSNKVHSGPLSVLKPYIL